MSKLYILEGADGTGKTTLANEILKQTKGHMLHATFEKDWDIRQYHSEMFYSALTLMKYQDVILDRWAVSEEVYAEAYRGGRQYYADNFMINIISDSRMSNPEDIRFIYCSNKDTIINHEANKELRVEMFNDISPVVKEYERYIGRTIIDWINYDFTKDNMKEFVEELRK